MDYETKKSIPRHLRGAATKRVRCRFCDSWHANKQQIWWCKKNPKRKEMIEKRREIGKRAAAITNSNPENIEKARKTMMAVNMLPQYAKKMEKARAKGGRNSPHQGMLGKHHTLEHRLRLLEYVRAYNHRKMLASIPKQLDRERVPAAMYQPHEFFGRKIEEKTEDLWIIVSDDDGSSGF